MNSHYDVHTSRRKGKKTCADYASDIKAAKWVVASDEIATRSDFRAALGVAELFSLAKSLPLHSHIEIFKVSINWPRGIYDPSFHAMLEIESILKMQKGAKTLLLI